ncbi:hypothetical protein EVJ50_00145 [Synechococcus sp. RSCCF101]|uniref:hypothetical protein n=1 Tax=Synechococcus sp. RSCCF101 TaxID=2511069 RepID=UPI001244C47B|nr:hypothetical protein [Synechococcus sp. RSCCF101]QEY30901.1 hypothetical protein EVJ50_00145 [Synechococcus sp. RSCCF101]
MIVLKISNASEVVASKVGRFLEFLTPDAMDEAAVEDEVMKKLIENLKAEGLAGEVASVKGLDLHEQDLIMKGAMKVRRHRSF